jgi:hypothetical protein
MPITLNGSGTVSGISAGGLPDGIIQSADLATGVGGKILQVLQVTKTDTASTGSNSYADISGLTQAITTTGSNKVLIRAIIHFGVNGGHSMLMRLARTTSGTTSNDIFIGDASSNRSRVSMGGHASNANWEQNVEMTEFLDSPSVGTHTYSIQWAVPSGASTMYLNRSERNNDDVSEVIVPSILTLMEVAA